MNASRVARTWLTGNRDSPLSCPPIRYPERVKSNFRHLDTLTIAFVVVLLVSNLIGPKVCQVGPLIISGAELLFPITYICGDIFTEVYGYAASRRAIWLGFGGMALLTLMGQFAYWAGEFTNSYTLAKLKLLTGGRFLWTRTVGSTITGQLVDTIVIILIAFWGVLPLPKLAVMVASAYGIKVAYEVLATPLTYLVVNRLKRSEGLDPFDRGTNFNPFAF